MPKQLTAKFFRITGFRQGKQVSLAAIDWAAFLKTYRDRLPNDRVHNLRGTFCYFEPRDTGTRHLAVHKFKEAGEVFSRIAYLDGAVTEIPAADKDGRYADTTCVVFMPFGNVFALVTNGSSAPRAGKMAEWLTELDPYLDKTQYGVEPLTSKPDLTKLQHADGASRISMRVPIEVLDQLPGAGTNAGAFSSLAPGAVATVSVSYGRRNPTLSQGQRLLEFAKSLTNLLTGGSSADVSIFHSVPAARKGKTKLDGELLDLVEHELASSFAIGQQTGEARIDGIMALIDNAAASLQSEVRRAWEASHVDEG